MKTNKMFNNLIITALIIYTALLILVVMLKAIIPNDLISNYNFLSTMNIKERLVRGLKIIDLYKIEYEIGNITKALILDILNIFIFIPFGLLASHLFNKNKLLKSVIIVFSFSLIFEIFQLITIIGAFMLNDLIINVIGGFIGSILYLWITKKERYKIYNTLLIIFIIFCIIILIYLILNFFINIEIYFNILTKNKIKWCFGTILNLLIINFFNLISLVQIKGVPLN